MKQLVVSKEKVIDATRSEVWEVIITPKYFDRWMLVPAKAENEKTLGLGSKIKWINEQGVAYLEGEVIEFIENQKIVISLQDISWEKTLPKGSVTYAFHLTGKDDGTLVRFQLGDLSVDPEGQDWYDAYNSSDEIGAIEKIISAKRN